MPLATCHRCQAVFIVDHDEQGKPRQLCPYCGRDLEPIAREEVERRIHRRRPSPGERDDGGADARAGRVVPMLAHPVRRIFRSLDARFR